jgi:hypothetical protein
MAADPHRFEDKAAWGSCLWNGYVVTGSTKGERRRRLAHVPEQWRASVEAHVRTASILMQKARQRQTGN